MKPLRWLMLLALFAHPVFAQDEGDGGFDVNSIFSNDPFNNRVAQIPKVDPYLVEIRSSLLEANAPPIETKQEGSLKKAYEKEWKAQSKAYEKRYGVTLESVWGLQTQARGGRRGGGSARITPARAAELRRISDQLRDKVIAALRIDQQATLRRYQSEQLRANRLDAMLESLTAAGVRLTPEQKKEIDSLYARESRLRTLIVIEAKGAPYQGKVAGLEFETAGRVDKVLDESQKIALAEAKARASSP